MLADGLRLPTVALVWLTDLDTAILPGGQPGSELVMRRGEAQAIAAPLSRILWKHREDWAIVRWVLSLESRVADQSDYVALALALGHYGTRVADLAIQAYAYKAAQAQQAASARQVGASGGKPAQQARSSRQSAQREPAGGSPAGHDAQPRGAAPVAVAGAEGVPQSVWWNGGAFGATFDGPPVAYGLADPVEPGDWLAGGN